MNVKYQIIKTTRHGLTISVGIPYKNKKRARTRCDTLDNIHGSYVHSLLEVPANPCDRDMSGPREPLKLSGINWEGC